MNLKDLLDARDHYHVHLAHLPHVVGTAVGRYLIHERDWWFTHQPGIDSDVPKGFHQPTSPRTLFNAAVRPWSWPCVLVFVDAWRERSSFASEPDCMVPRALYLPDGRVVPTCVVFVEEQPVSAGPDYHLSFPRTLVGGGCLTLADVQGCTHMGSIGCLVTDGDLTYALTNRHVTGGPGREIYTSQHGRRVLLGISDEKQLGDKAFVRAYPGWAGDDTRLQIDAGLIRIDDLNGWTSQVVGIGSMDEWVDLNTDTLTLDMITQPVRAFGAASGLLHGEIAALFYRYGVAGGTEYVTDFLIRPHPKSRPTVHGDSGTLWLWEQKVNDKTTRLRPMAIQWGGQVWTDSRGVKGRTGTFALATSISLICRELGVTVVRDCASNLPQYWGDVGHYTIGFFACDGMKGKLGSLMKANQLNVSYPHDSILSGTLIKKRGADGFVPLADVPDRIWAHGETIRGGADKPNHFADMDQKDPARGGKTLLELCRDPANVSPDFWLAYYESVGDTSRGLLPFRVWQFFDEMQDAAKKKDVTRFVAAAGTCAHYVGDACQPLHCSFLHDGYPGGKGSGVHSAYEDKMLRSHAPEILTELTKALSNASGKVTPPKNGQEAAVAVVELMRRTFKTIPPADIVDAFVAKKDLWTEFGAGTVKVIQDGVRTLQAVWQGAWSAGNGEAVGQAKLAAAATGDLIKLYRNKNWAPSKTLKTIKDVLQ
ncbi:MAG TPA: hypothetical protein VN519_10425 [Bryobacteraceae bacterium]|nr:hypothetical protein [Bryobacteraceae bacterium]